MRKFNLKEENRRNGYKSVTTVSITSFLLNFLNSNSLQTLRVCVYEKSKGSFPKHPEAMCACVAKHELRIWCCARDTKSIHAQWEDDQGDIVNNVGWINRGSRSFRESFNAMAKVYIIYRLFSPLSHSLLLLNLFFFKCSFSCTRCVRSNLRFNPIVPHLPCVIPTL